jgi:hypothetical protein
MQDKGRGQYFAFPTSFLVLLVGAQLPEGPISVKGLGLGPAHPGYCMSVSGPAAWEEVGVFKERPMPLCKVVQKGQHPSQEVSAELGPPLSQQL